MKGDVKLVQKIQYEAKYNRIFFAILLCIGLINNLGSVLVVSCAQQFAKELNNQALVGFYPMAIKLFSSFSRFVNSKFCIKISYLKRVIFLSCYFLVGYLSLFTILLCKKKMSNFNKTLGFVLSLFPSFIMGSGEALGEVNVLGYLRALPGDFISGWSTGTGFAGVGGAGLTLLFKLLGLDTMLLYLFLSPVTIIYFLLFFTSTKVKVWAEDSARANLGAIKSADGLMPKDEENVENKGEAPTDKSAEEENKTEEDKTKEEENKTEEVPQEGETDVKENKAMSIENFKLAFSKGKYYILNLALVYYLEYAAYSGFSERVSFFKRVTDTRFQEYCYEYFCLCYQTGVLISRSSLALLKHNPYVIIYSLIQFVNYVFLFCCAYFSFLHTWWVFFIILVETGLMGGSSYVGCLYYLMNTDTIEPKLRELCLNIGTIFNDLGIVLASVTTLIVDNTIMNKDPQG
ncbi:MAG: battenin family protein [archaeon]|nr:battenin family protein [archaeon]